MPYLKFKSRKSERKFDDILDEIMQQKADKSEPPNMENWMVAFVKDDNFGILHFMSDNLYAFVVDSLVSRDGVKLYDIIQHDKVTAPYALSLRERYPGLGY